MAALNRVEGPRGPRSAPVAGLIDTAAQVARLTRALTVDAERLRHENAALARERDEVLALVAAASRSLSPREIPSRSTRAGRRMAALDTATVTAHGNGHRHRVELRLERDTQMLHVGAEQVPLARRECALLSHLLDHAERAHSVDDLLDTVWGDRPGVDRRTVRVHVRMIRSKLERFDGLPLRISTVHGSGYRADHDGEPALLHR